MVYQCLIAHKLVYLAVKNCFDFAIESGKREGIQEKMMVNFYFFSFAEEKFCFFLIRKYCFVVRLFVIDFSGENEGASQICSMQWPYSKYIVLSNSPFLALDGKQLEKK